MDDPSGGRRGHASASESPPFTPPRAPTDPADGGMCFPGDAMQGIEAEVLARQITGHIFPAPSPVRSGVGGGLLAQHPHGMANTRPTYTSRWGASERLRETHGVGSLFSKSGQNTDGGLEAYLPPSSDTATDDVSVLQDSAAGVGAETFASGCGQGPSRSATRDSQWH